MRQFWRDLRDLLSFRRVKRWTPVQARGELAETIRDFVAANGYDVVTYSPMVIGPLGGESARLIVSQVTPDGELSYMTVLVYARGVYAQVQ